MLWRLRGLLSAMVVAGLLMAATAFAQENRAGEYEVKAAFLFNFARFAEWPASAAESQPLVIGIIGQDPFDSQILEGLAHKSVNGRPITIRHFKDARDIDNCNVLFVGAVKDKDMTAIIDAVKGRGILTVGESSSFLNAGGMIRFCFKDDKIRFEINMPQIDGGKLKLSAKLLSVAIIVRP